MRPRGSSRRRGRPRPRSARGACRSRPESARSARDRAAAAVATESSSRRPLRRREQILAGVVGLSERGQREPHVTLAIALLARRARLRGRAATRARKPLHAGEDATVGIEGEATDRDWPPAPRIARAGRRPPLPTATRQRSATAAKRSGPESSRHTTWPSAASAEPPRSGCSKTNHGSPARREAHTTADGSMSSGSARVIVASVGLPERRARCSASSSRARRPFAV